MSLTTLPILPLEVIASYLDFSSLVSLSASTSSLAHLQPKQQIVKGENFSVAGINPTYSPKRISKKGISLQRSHHPEHYFDVEIETPGLLGIKMVWEWEGKWVSSGWCGTRSGFQHFTEASLWLQLVRDGKVLEEYQYKGQAPEKRHEGDNALDDFYSWRYPGPPDDLATWQFDHKQEVFVEEQHPLITQARNGDLIRVWVFVEGRHGLQVRNCQMTLLHKSPLSTEEPLPTEQPLPREQPGQIKRRLVKFWGRLSSIF